VLSRHVKLTLPPLGGCVVIYHARRTYSHTLLIASQDYRPRSQGYRPAQAEDWALASEIHWTEARNHTSRHIPLLFGSPAILLAMVNNPRIADRTLQAPAFRDARQKPQTWASFTKRGAHTRTPAQADLPSLGVHTAARDDPEGTVSGLSLQDFPRPSDAHAEAIHPCGHGDPLPSWKRETTGGAYILLRPRLSSLLVAAHDCSSRSASADPQIDSLLSEQSLFSIHSKRTRHGTAQKRTSQFAPAETSGRPLQAPMRYNKQARSLRQA